MTVVNHFKITPLLFPLFLVGCTSVKTIENSTVRDRVFACSAGFKQVDGLKLNEAFDKTHLNGKLTADFHAQAKSAIFSALPKKDRLNAYHDYIRCIEMGWNQSDKNINKN